MIGWGLPLLLCSVIISIVKSSYLTVPYGVCFTNSVPILIGSLLLPVCVLLLVKCVFIILIFFTLRRIVKDLKSDVADDLVTKLESNDSLSDKLKLCQNWADKTSSSPVVPQAGEPSNGSTPTPTSPVESVGSGSSNNYSEQTSVMDAQYKPNVQVKFAILSYLLLVLVWACGALLVNAYRFVDSSGEVSVKLTSNHF